MNRYAGRKAPLKLLTLTLKLLAINRCLTHGAAERSSTGITVAPAFIIKHIDWKRLQTVFVCACVCERKRRNHLHYLYIQDTKYSDTYSSMGKGGAVNLSLDAEPKAGK